MIAMAATRDSKNRHTCQKPADNANCAGLAPSRIDNRRTIATNAATHNWPVNTRFVTPGLLVLGNLLPLFGVLFLDWDAGSVVIFYWSENLIIGACTIIKMLHAHPIGGTFTSAFFLIHYGGFCAVHGLFAVTLMGLGEFTFFESEPWPLFLAFVQLLVEVIRHVLQVVPPEWLLGFSLLAISHGVSLVINYFMNGEYRDQDIKSLMSEPYKRIVVLHIAIIGGGFGVMLVGSPVPLLAMLVLLKTGLDLYLHMRTHGLLGVSAPVLAPTVP
jgi:hypothetical protein